MNRAFLAGFLALPVSFASAASHLYEPFDYNGTGFPPLSGQVNTYVSPSRTWTKAGTTLDPQISDGGSLNYPGLPAGIGNSAFTSGIGATTPSSHARIGLGTDLTSVYYSMLIKVPAAAENMGANGVAGSFFAGLQFLTTGTSATSAASLLIRSHNGANTAGTPDVATTFDLGIAYRDTAVRLWDTNGTDGTPGVGSTDGAGYNPGDTIFLVVRYDSNQSIAGTDSRDDSASIWIFDGADVIPELQPAAATITSTNTGATNDYFYANDTTRTDVAVRTIHLRNNGSEPSNIEIDELRVGDSWADVVLVPEPTALAFLGAGALGLLARRRRA